LRTRPAQRTRTGGTRSWHAPVVLCLSLGLSWLPTRAAASCDNWQATLVAIEGQVEILAEQGSGWEPARPGQPVCDGDAVRVGEYSRASVLLPSQLLLKLDQHSNLVFAQPPDRKSTWVELLRGVIHVISRDPRALGFNTPYANAGLEGTEFVLAVGEDGTSVTVIEGTVVLSNAAGAVSVHDGQRAMAGANQVPTAIERPNPLGDAQWSLYYLPVLTVEEVAADDPLPMQPSAQAAFLIARAARRLSVGRVGEAQSDLDRLDELAPGHADGGALRAIIALTHHDRDGALRLARDAVRADADSAAALIALSWAEQATFSFEAAREGIEQALAVDPNNALAWARAAELRLADGDAASGIEAARRAVALAPELGYAHTMLGFGELLRLRNQAAAATFIRAIELDQAAPLARLGLGLALFRQRRVAEARIQIELAVLLDPGNALARSYLAKSYFDEHRGELSGVQLGLAREFDPLDPTPWLYDALRKQAANRPVEALGDLRTAVLLNEQRPVSRSSLRIDPDHGARSAGVGRLHRDLGFEQLAMIAGWRAANDDPAEFSGHRLLADVYSTLPRHEIARVNELYQAQLLQPINVTPIPPQLAEANLFILDRAGPAELAFTELAPLTAGNGLSIQGSAVAGGRGTRGENLMLAGRHDSVAYSVGYFHFQSDGFRANNDIEQTVANGFVQFRPGARTSVMTELRHSDTDKGDLRMLFDPDGFNPLLRQHEQVGSLRVGLRRDLRGSDVLLASVIVEDNDQGLRSGPGFQARTRQTAYATDVQYQQQLDRVTLVSGLSYRSYDVDEVTRWRIQLPGPPFEIDTTENFVDTLSAASVYSYLQYSPRPRWTATFGASYDEVEGRLADRRGVQPKLGLTWEAGPDTTLRLAAMRTLQGWAASRHSIIPQLEPTQVAGFNQRYFGSEGERGWRYGVAADHRAGARVYTGLEVSRRALSVPTAVILPPSPAPMLAILDVDEQLARAYVYWTPTDTLAIHAHYQYEHVDGNGALTTHAYTALRTHRLPLGLNWFHPHGFSAGLHGTRVHQHGEFAAAPFAPGSPTTPGSARFWSFDGSLGYRLPRRRGVLSLNVHNLFDRRFRFQDTDPDNPRLIPERMIALRFTVMH
jgi:tetratricopeptide (TPR) repeat protein